MSEINLLEGLLQGGTTAGLLLIVGWFFFSKIFVIMEKQLEAFKEEMEKERNQHKAEVNLLSESMLSLTYEIRKENPC